MMPIPTWMQPFTAHVDAADGYGAQLRLLDRLAAAGLLKVPEVTIADDVGVARMAHYGKPGEQTWDVGIREGWAPEAAAFNAHKYVTRDPALKGVDRARDLKHGRWYYARLVEMVRGTGSLPKGTVGIESQCRSVRILKTLQELLTDDQRQLLRKQGE